MVTSALPYTNGPVHIGHLAGVYIPSDIYVRYLRLKGKDVLWVCGSDEHGVPITLKAKKEGISPQDVVDKYHKIIKKSFSELGISFDIYHRTSDKLHHKTASDFFEKLYKDGKFIEKTTEQYFDTEANQFLADRYITGTCPHCGNGEAYGDQCENCGTALSALELINPKSTISGSKPVKKETKHWYLALDKNEAFLKEWILEGHKEWKSNVYGQCKSWIDKGLLPRAVSRDLGWGVPVPVEGAEGKVLYVWFDAPIGYISATKALTPDWEKYWKDENTKLVHFIGKDNIVFHCIIFPTMLKEEGSYILPENVPANAFLNLEGAKISTSKNHAVWLHEYLEDFEDAQDVLRYTLTANAPETKDNNFTWKDFQDRNNNELVAIFGNFINRTAVLIQKYYEGKIPEAGEFTQEDKIVFEKISTYAENIGKSIENYRFREALASMMNIARLGNKYLADNEPWKIVKTNPERVKTIMYVSTQIAANLSIICEPFLPFTAQKLRKILNIEKFDINMTGNDNLISSSHIINKSTLLFRKIEDKEIEFQMEKLEKAKKKNEMKIVEPVKNNISFDDFQKTDIRTATILEAVKVKKTKKLLQLKVDTGIDIRTIVSGISEFYKPEEIIGKKVLIVINIEPVKLRGIMSEGMILMAKNPEGKLLFVQAEKDTENGSQVM